MSVKLNWEINYSFSKPSAEFSSARRICAVLRKAGYSEGTFSSDVFGRHRFNLKKKNQKNHVHRLQLQR